MAFLLDEDRYRQGDTILRDQERGFDLTKGSGGSSGWVSYKLEGPGVGPNSGDTLHFDATERGQALHPDEIASLVPDPDKVRIRVVQVGGGVPQHSLGIIAEALSAMHLQFYDMSIRTSKSENPVPPPPITFIRYGKDGDIYDA